MRKNLSDLLFISAAIVLFLTSCGSMKTMSLNSIELTTQLKPGMTYNEVESLLGKPKSSMVSGDKMIARWNLQEMWKGYIPYDMIFNSADQTLISWAENSKAWEAQQAQLKVVADEVQKQAVANNQSGKSGGGPAPSFENNPDLMNYFKGKWYSFTSAGYGYTASSERTISLCGDGTYKASFESGYSGTNQGWGQATQSGGAGTWRITGNKTEGTIVTTSPDGKATTYKYKTCGDGCIYFGSNKYAYAGAPECR